MKLGLIGCGNVSDVYLRNAATSDLVEFKTVASASYERARAKAAAYGLIAVPIDELLADPEIDIVLNLTVPVVHAEISHRIIAAGKHLYSEKPLGISLSEARALIDAAQKAGVRIACAPDTFLGAGHQACRRFVDEGRLGQIIAGAATMGTHGVENWHPNPAFFYQRGGGPVLDATPYLLTVLVNILGPIRRVAAIATRAASTRTIGSQALRGKIIEVEVPTTANALLEFVQGANVSLTASWDIWKHRREPFEIYGLAGTLLMPHPGQFGGTPCFAGIGDDWKELATSDFPFGSPNTTARDGTPAADYRLAGVIDLAEAIQSGRPHRANEALAFHVMEAMEAMTISSVEGRHVSLKSSCERPKPVSRGSTEAALALSRIEM